MRLEPTYLERRSGEALVQRFSESFTVENVAFGDRPDLTFNANGIAVSIEITSLLPSDVHHAIKTHFDKLYRQEKVAVGMLVVPMEPDMWIKAAIERKWKSVQKYPNFSQMANLSLLVHRPGILLDVIDYDEPGFVNALHYGTAKAQHGFANIFYWTNNGVKSFERPSAPVPDVQHDVTNGYPAWITLSHIGTSKEGQAYFVDGYLSTDVPKEHTRIITPMTVQFQGLKPHMPPKHRIKIYYGPRDDDESISTSTQTV
ncbi:hypothetical protein [Massilia varians]|uniref:hypothetical protein n=1 Tax=Massilia varians TaxID=457921 RepID=UPI002554190C|nr:hypothetical protein [Massilia varians]MDK6080608.1 hypothetical protein [Massilia varians]